MIEIDKWEDTKNEFPYLDILDLEHPNPRNHPRMPKEARAGQFSPYAALTGYEEAVQETARYTSSKKELDEAEKEKLDEVMNEIKLHPKEEIKIIYFEKDKKKAGGKYKEIEGIIKKIHTVQRQIELQNGMKIPLEDIMKIERKPTQE